MPVPSYRIRCVVCEEFADDLISIFNHLETDAHKRKKLEASEQTINEEKTTIEISAVSRKREELVNALYCELCDVKTTGVERTVSHFRSKKHKKNLRYHADERNDIERKDNQRKLVRLLKEVEMKKMGIFKCSLCSIKFITKRAFKKHVKSENHHQQIKIIRSIKMQRNDLVFPMDMKSILNI